jgi:hypothetical protein
MRLETDKMAQNTNNWLERLRPSGPRVLASVGVIIVITMLWIWVVSYQRQSRLALFSKAAGTSFQNSQSASNAIKELASYKDDQSTTLLLDIAAGNTQLQLDSIRIEAIRALRERKSNKVAVGLASLFQPHNGLDLRTAAAESLQAQATYCNQECIIFICHYLERVFTGEPNAEDRWTHSLDSDMASKQKTLYEMLFSILRGEPQETAVVLRNTYGLGTVSPSRFGVDLSLRARLSDSCPLLLQSSQRLRKIGPELFRAPRDELQRAITSLHCAGVR